MIPAGKSPAKEKVKEKGCVRVAETFGVCAGIMHADLRALTDSIVERGAPEIAVHSRVNSPWFCSHLTEQTLLEIEIDCAQGDLIEQPQLFTHDSLLRRPVRPRSFSFEAPGTFR